MPKDASSQRRRAAVAVLSGLLDETHLLHELWIQHDTMRGESVTEIIEYVDALAKRQMLDKATAKRLYGEFFKALKLSEAELPSDPWPGMQQLRPPASLPSIPAAYRPIMQPPMQAPWQAPWPAGVVSPQPGFAQPAAPGIAAAYLSPAYLQPAAAAAAPAAPMAQPAHAEPAPAQPSAEGSVVFGALMRSVVAEIVQFHGEALEEIRRDALRLLAGSKVPSVLREQFVRAWQRAQHHDWQLQGLDNELAELTRVVYRALEMAFGRAGADQILQRGTQAAEDLPEADEFSPKRLLAAL